MRVTTYPPSQSEGGRERSEQGDARNSPHPIPAHIHNNRPAHNRRNASFQTATVTRIAAIPAITNANGAPHS